MKKGLLVLTAVLMAVVAQADFILDVSCSYGLYAKGGGSMLGAPGDAMVELYYVGDNGLFDTAAGAGVLGDVNPGGNGDDVLLTSFVASAGSYADFAPVGYTGAYLGSGELFARIWNPADASAGGPWYYQSAILVANNLDPLASPPPTPDGLDIGGGQAGQIANMGQVIPEPATLGLMGIAGLGMFLARRKVRR